MLNRFNIFNSFLEQGWHLIIAYDYIVKFSDLAEKIIANDNKIKYVEYPFYEQLRNIYSNLVNSDKLTLSTTFYPVDYIVKNPYLDTYLYNDFNKLIDCQIINFNYDFYLEFNDITFEELEINEEDLYKEFLVMNLVKSLNYNSNISYNLINYLFDLNNFVVED